MSSFIFSDTGLSEQIGGRCEQCFRALNESLTGVDAEIGLAM